jgi:hypothetical protein
MTAIGEALPPHIEMDCKLRLAEVPVKTRISGDQVGSADV